MRLSGLATIGTNQPESDFWLVRKGSDKEVGRPVREFSPEHIGILVGRKAARQSTGKGFLRWDPGPCPECEGSGTIPPPFANSFPSPPCHACEGKGTVPGDAKQPAPALLVRVHRETDLLLPDYLFYIFMDLYARGYWVPRACGSLRLRHIRILDVKRLELSIRP
jgi:hypothetical protein